MTCYSRQEGDLRFTGAFRPREIVNHSHQVRLKVALTQRVSKSRNGRKSGYDEVQLHYPQARIGALVDRA